ncbi:MAG: UDP-N-acetylmuramoyl-tripeptide--D-alanyl-D-alanine ligase [Fibromonadaceae bacterium]|jgi:UDP-N-acetylmuramoyl-tripeptide--D-alanyl-D-alanine ligase|nr:UDP-N-acetylmuramoyl-tripeptide--D-alanyl-D-alanine ligase [Fibromonadaceae bacterium]
MSFNLPINVTDFLRIFSQENPSAILADVPLKNKKQKVCLNFDSREIKEGDIFWALVGKTFNPHKGKFIEEAFNKGALMAIVNAAEVEIGKIPLAIATEDTTRALLKFARGYRKSFSNLKVVGITGSAGKTSTKEMIAAVLSNSYNTHVTKGNLNNLFGVPMTLLGLKAEHEAAVIEMGTSLPGEIRQLSQAAAPDIAVITNVAPAHLDGLGSLEGVFEEKKSIVDGFEKSGTLVINADDVRLSKIRSTKKYKVLTYGVQRGTVKPDEVLWENGCASFRIARTWFKLEMPGLHSLYNALAAIAVGELLRIPKGVIAEAISSVKAYDMRMQILEGNDITVISDCYNANPYAMEVSLKTLANIPCSGRKIAVLGDMKELGERSKEYHRKTGSALAKLSIDYLVAIGNDALEYCEGAEEAGLKAGRIKYFENNASAIDALKLLLRKKDMVLVKGSRSMKLEEVANNLLEMEFAR